MRTLYDLWYRHGTPPWVVGPREELVRLVESGRIRPCRAIDLGCGVGDNAVFLARHGFEVTGVDYAPSAIAKARRNAEAAGVRVRFEVDDLTRLEGDYGTYDLLVDYGTFDDFRPSRRSGYLANVVPLAESGGRFLLWCFEWELTRAERWLQRVGGVALEPGEVESIFGDRFEIERVGGEARPKGWPKGYAAYLMTREATEASA